MMMIAGNTLSSHFGGVKGSVFESKPDFEDWKLAMADRGNSKMAQRTENHIDEDKD